MITSYKGAAIREKKSRRLYNYELTCSYCGTHFNSKASETLITDVFACSSCANLLLKEEKITVTALTENGAYVAPCPHCGVPKMRKQNRLNSPCKACSIKEKTGPGICVKCGSYVEKRTITKLCSKCNCKSGPGVCTRCDCYSETRNGAGVCPSCISSSNVELNKNLRDFVYDKDCNENCPLYGNCTYDNPKKNKYGYCEYSPIVDQRQPGMCTRCGSYSTSRSIAGLCPNCIKESNIKLNKELNTFESDIECNPKCENYDTCTHKDRPKNRWGWCKESLKSDNFEEFRKFESDIQCNPKCKNYEKCTSKDRPKNKFGWCKESPNIYQGNNNFEEFHKFESNVDCNPKCKSYDTCTHKDQPKNRWGWCKDSPNISSYYSFNREEFYSSSYNVTTYESVNKMITEFDKLEGVPGVWAIYCNDICLDVCETQDIGNEMYQTVRRLNYCKDKTDEELQDKSYNWRKVRDIVNVGKLDFVLIAKDVESKEDRWRIEAQYAHDNKARY